MQGLRDSAEEQCSPSVLRSISDRPPMLLLQSCKTKWVPMCAWLPVAKAGATGAQRPALNYFK